MTRSPRRTATIGLTALAIALSGAPLSGIAAASPAQTSPAPMSPDSMRPDSMRPAAAVSTSAGTSTPQASTTSARTKPKPQPARPAKIRGKWLTIEAPASGDFRVEAHCRSGRTVRSSGMEFREFQPAPDRPGTRARKPGRYVTIPAGMWPARVLAGTSGETNGGASMYSTITVAAGDVAIQVRATGTCA